MRVLPNSILRVTARATLLRSQHETLELNLTEVLDLVPRIISLP